MNTVALLVIGMVLGVIIDRLVVGPPKTGNATLMVGGRDTVVVSAGKYDTVVVSLKKDTVVVSAVDFGHCLKVPRPDDCPPLVSYKVAVP
jgi:hypothetical protein